MSKTTGGGHTFFFSAQIEAVLPWPRSKGLSMPKRHHSSLLLFFLLGFKRFSKSKLTSRSQLKPFLFLRVAFLSGGLDYHSLHTWVTRGLQGRERICYLWEGVRQVGNVHLLYHKSKKLWLVALPYWPYDFLYLLLCLLFIVHRSNLDWHIRSFDPVHLTYSFLDQEVRRQRPHLV